MSENEQISTEMCDVYDRSGARTSRTVSRGTPLLGDEYYLVVQVWIRDVAGDYLVQQRAPHLASGPGMWATTAGYVLSGEDSLSGAIREVREELGIQLTPAQLWRFDQVAMDGMLQDIWMADVSKDAIGAPVLGPEVADFRWAAKAELVHMIGRGDFYAYSYLNSMPG
jgi:8-oxo-dGTP pyrophosphatase MutT (NUDIX family)